MSSVAGATTASHEDGINGASGVDVIPEGATDGRSRGMPETEPTPHPGNERVPLAVPPRDFSVAPQKNISEAFAYPGAVPRDDGDFVYPANELRARFYSGEIGHDEFQMLYALRKNP